MVGARAFILIFLLMPLGHALMVAMNKFLGDYLSLGVVVVFLIGLVTLFATRLTVSEAWQTFMGILAGILLWTGAVEYGLIFGAQDMGVGELHGTNGEYRIMKHTWGFALLVCLYLLFHEGVRCTFFVWLRTKLRLIRGSVVSGRVSNYGPRAMFESVAILWFFYVLLLLLYDEGLVGVHHPLTYIAFCLTLGAGAWMFVRLLRIKQPGYAMRYAFPTVVVFWNAVEIAAKWQLFKEPWLLLDPWIMSMIVIAMVVATYFVVQDLKHGRVAQKT